MLLSQKGEVIWAKGLYGEKNDKVLTNDLDKAPDGRR